MPTAINANPFKSLKAAININPRECDLLLAIWQVELPLYKAGQGTKSCEDTRFPQLNTVCPVRCKNECLRELPVRHNSLTQVVRRRVLNFHAHVEKRVSGELISSGSLRFKNPNRRLRNRIAHHEIVVALHVNVRVPSVEYSVFCSSVAIALQSNVFEGTRSERFVVAHFPIIS